MINPASLNRRTALSLEGLIAATFTPMGTDGAVAFAQIGPMVDFVITQGAQGLYVLGSTGEGASLTTVERTRAADAFVRAARGRVPVVVQVGHASIAESRSLAAHAAGVGADAISATPPTYFKPETLDVLVACMADIAAAAPALPFYYYHLPGVTGVRFDMVKFLEQGAGAIPNLRGIKFSDPQVFEMAACIELQQGRFDIVFGYDEMMLSGFVAGARGAVGSTYNFAGPLYREIIAAFAAGRVSEAAEAQQRAAAMVDIILKCGGRGGLKAMMAVMGCDCGPNRLPIVTMPPAQRKTMESLLTEAGILPHLRATRRCVTPPPAALAS
ncbi:MAG TPA: dihydrodipicolinate synthase family protein [Opitutaceae bacterium]|nr:dihydrodipicolinate synthase family protein [Opitutaceae bacterium]